jgi:hypothetical protein
MSVPFLEVAVALVDHILSDANPKQAFLFTPVAVSSSHDVKRD